MPKICDLTGDTYGRLTVLRKSGRKTSENKSIWVCRCTCGAEKEVAAANLKAKQGTKSCGCLSQDNCRIVGRSCRLSDPRESSFRILLRTYKRAADKRLLNWGLTDDEFRAYLTQDCFYCKRPPSNTVRCRGRTMSEEWQKLTEFHYNGVDRLFNGLGYSRANCVSCCWQCNVAKMDVDIVDFLEWVARVGGNVEELTKKVLEICPDARLYSL